MRKKQTQYEIASLSLAMTAGALAMTAGALAMTAGALAMTAIVLNKHMFCELSSGRK